MHRPVQALDRRRMLQGGAVGAFALGGCATTPGSAPVRAPAPNPQSLPKLRAQADRIFDITVCTRPFRAEGPRLDVETIGDARIVHNYGYGGSGWSLSWGGASIAVAKAMESSPRAIAVVGCGAIGITSALTAQQAGAKVTIYAKELLPRTRSARATGVWTPDSRIALTDKAAPGFGDLWEKMARTSFKTYRNYLGLPGTPVEWYDQYMVYEDRPSAGGHAAAEGALDFASYQHRIRDLTPRQRLLADDAAPFRGGNVHLGEQMMFNIADYARILLSDFLAAGGRIQIREFHAPSELATLDEKVVINCPGYGGRALWKDETIVPVRGQIGWLIPQAEVRYGLYFKHVNVVPRRDGFVVQSLEGGDMRGYGVLDETPDRAEAEGAVAAIAELMSRAV